MAEAPNLTLLARDLEFRWRVKVFITAASTALIVSTAIALAFAVANVVVLVSLPVGRVALLATGAALAVAMLQTALKRRSAGQFLADADRAYETGELLCSAFEFSAGDTAGKNPTERAFRAVVVSNGELLSRKVVPATVYPLALPSRASIVAALIVAIGVILLLDASGWFARPAVELSQEGLLLEDAGRRLAQRGNDAELTELADEIRRLGERLRNGELTAEQARRRIEQLGETVEEQIRNLERFGEFDTNQNMQIPPETEESVRSALSSGMSEGDVLEFFMRMRAGGDSLPDVLRALEGATENRSPDANVDIDEERLRELLDQLNLPADSPAENDVAGGLDSVRESLNQAGAGLQELTEGQPGDSSEPGSGSGRRIGPDDPQGPEELSSGGPDSQDQSGSGQQGGETAVTDEMNDSFTGIEESNPFFRQIEGTLGQGSIRDVIIRELPSEAISRMTETEREVAFKRVIEEAVGRENTPPELQRLIRNYFLRITLGRDQGEQNEQ